jgi:hypothetical protein
MTHGDLVLVKYWHLKKKCVISIPGLYLYKHLYLDDPEQTVYFVLILEPITNKPITFETTKLKPVLCL